MAKSHNASDNLLFSFMEENLLSQYITQPTRNQNIIDLFLTNNANLVLQTQSINTNLSDHNLIKVQSTYNINKVNTNIKPKISNHTFRSLNLQKADYAKINSHLESIDWDVLISVYP